jgi:RNA polymerase sigma factor (sigma-70 family)
VHIPTYMVTLINHWRHTSTELENQLGKTPDIEEMADIMKVSLRKAKIIDRIVEILSSTTDSLEGDDSGEEQIYDTSLEDQSTGQPEDALVADEEKTTVLKLLNEIEPREAAILRLHYGLNGKEPVTLRDIGKKLGLTRERIRQILRGALTKLYEYMNEE